MALPRAGAFQGAGAPWLRAPRFGGAVAAAVAVHALLLLFRLGPSAASYAAPAAPVMAVRMLPSPTAAPVTAPAMPMAMATPMPMPTPAIESAATVAAPAPAEARRVEQDRPLAGSDPVALPPLAVSPPPAEAAALRPPDAMKTPPAEAKPAPDKALPAAPDYAFGIRLDPGPRPLEEIEPEYPDPVNLREGTVVLRLLISDTGHVDNVAVVRAEPRGVFEQAAIEAFAKARFSPGLAAGTPVKSQIMVEVNFVPINRGARVSGRTY